MGLPVKSYFGHISVSGQGRSAAGSTNWFQG